MLQDLILVAGFRMDAAGAAIATVAAQAVSVLFALWMLMKKKLPFKITKADFKINSQCKRALKIGLPLALQECLTQISCFSSLLKKYFFVKHTALCSFISTLLAYSSRVMLRKPFGAMVSSPDQTPQVPFMFFLIIHYFERPAPSVRLVKSIHLRAWP